MSRRLKVLCVDADCLVYLFKQDRINAVLENKLPDDAKPAGIYFDDETACMKILVESSTFEEVSIGKRVPLLDIVILKDMENQ